MTSILIQTKSKKENKKKSDTPRWRFEILSPVNGEVIWTYDAFKVNDVCKKWKKETGNTFLSRAKAVRACNGELHCPFIRCYKINDWAGLHLKNLEEETESTIDDYSTSGETDFSSGEDTDDTIENI